HQQTVPVCAGRGDLNVLDLLRQVTLSRVYVLLVVPNAAPLLAVPGVCVCRLVVAAGNADGSHDNEEIAPAGDTNLVNGSEIVHGRGAIDAEEVGSAQAFL